MTINQLIIEKTELKHDINLRLGMVFEPFSWMKLPGAMEKEFFPRFGQEMDTINHISERVCSFLDQKWNVEGDPEEEQLEQFYKKADIFCVDSIVIIKEACNFYQKLQKKYGHLYNLNNQFGLRAKETSGVAIGLKKCLISDIMKLSVRRPLKDRGTMITSSNLLCLVEEVLDQIKNADVWYEHELEFCDTMVYVDKDLFVNSVLNNIQANIIRHAFSTSLTKENYLFENKVKVSFEENDDSVIIYIANNGAPYIGDTNKLFTPGFYEGEKGHSGYGLHSAREAMRAMGGDLAINTSANREFVFTYKITLKK